MNTCPPFYKAYNFGVRSTQSEHIVHEVHDHFSDRPQDVTAAADLENAFNSARELGGDFGFKNKCVLS